MVACRIFENMCCSGREMEHIRIGVYGIGTFSKKSFENQICMRTPTNAHLCSTQILMHFTEINVGVAVEIVEVHQKKQTCVERTPLLSKISHGE